MVRKKQKEIELDTKRKSEHKGEKRKKIRAVFAGERVISGMSNETQEIYDKSRFGEVVENKMQYSLVEGLFLLENGRMEIKLGRKALNFEDYVKKAQEAEPKFWIRYCIYKDIRKRGYIIKTALKFGAPFRIYDRGVKPGEDHARWIVYPVHEGESLTWYEFAAKNRVAHSTKKRLLIGIVDDEGDVTYYECKWMRP